MARKTREDYQREKEIQARVDLVRAGRGGGHRGMYLQNAAAAEAEVARAKTAGAGWKPRMYGFGWFGYALLIGLLAFLGYLIVVYGGLG